jgi:hypothetical protein
MKRCDLFIQPLCSDGYALPPNDQGSAVGDKPRWNWRFDTLLLALAIAVLWIYRLGEQLLPEERRKEIDPAYRRQLSVFQLGWRLLRRLLSCATPPSCTPTLKLFRPEPVWQGKC